MDTIMEQEIQTPVNSDVSEALPLSKQLEVMTKAELIKYADTALGYQIDDKLTKPVIIENILKIDASRKTDAQKVNEESLAAAVSEDDPEITVRFYNMETSGADLEFAYSGKRGMYGPKNKQGFKKCPRYHLFPGETVKLAYSVYEHLSSLTYVTHKTVWDTNTGNIKGNIPIVKPRFLLQPIFTKEQLFKLNA
jgi:hypothetical protein